MPKWIFALPPMLALIASASHAQINVVLKPDKYSVAEKIDSTIPGEFIIQMRTAGKEGLSSLRKTLTGAVGVNKIQELRLFQTDSHLVKIKLETNRSTQSLMRSLRENSEIIHVEPNYEVKAAAVPDDASFSKLWGLQNTGQTDSEDLGRSGLDIGAIAVWNQGFTGSKDVIVAVIDSGIDLTHPDLKDNLYANPGESGELATNGVDDDGNGFIDDYMGWNFFGKNNNAHDDNNHGTHCAGTIGAVGNNGVGVVGVNWNVSLMPIKFLGAKGSGDTADAIESVKYATKMGARVLSNSWGGGGYSKLLEDAIIEARDKGVLFIAAAGNGDALGMPMNNDVDAHYPSNYEVDNVVSVAAGTNWDRRAWFSNYGKNTVDLAAPGYNIFSTIPCKRDSAGACKTPLVQYDYMSGTSMATPHVAGAAAMLLSLHPNWGYQELKDRLFSTVRPVRLFKDRMTTGGTLDLESAVRGYRLAVSGPAETEWEDVAYSLETTHPYVNELKQDITINVPGAKYIRIVFDNLELEEDWDFLTLSDANGVVYDEFDSKGSGVFSAAIPGDTVQFKFETDKSVTKYGYLVSRIQVVK